MIDGIHGTHPICYQLDKAIAKAAAMGRPIASIQAAEPFVENLEAELGEVLSFPSDGDRVEYKGIPIITRSDWEHSWMAFDAGGKYIEV
jgi:hypothetical protein